MTERSTGAECAYSMDGQGAMPPMRRGIRHAAAAALMVLGMAVLPVQATASTQFSINPGAIEQPTGSGGNASESVVRGDGVVLATGNKLESELDFAVSGDMGLYLLRTYNNYWAASGLFGGRWLSNFDYSLAFSTVNGQKIAWAQRPDGRRLKFVPAGSDRWNEDKSAAIAYIVRNADGSYTLHNEERGSETYDAGGYITRRNDATGIGWEFTYSGKLLQRVTHSSGSSVQFAWANGAVTKVIDPNGSVYTYGYTANVFGVERPRLASTTLPGQPAATITYAYEDARFPGALTGKSRNGVRIASFAYDDKNRVVSTERANGVEKFTFAYTVEGEVAITDPPLPPPPGGYRAEEVDRPICGRIVCTVPRSVEGPILLQSISPTQVGTAVVGGGATTLATAGAGSSVPKKMTVVETNPLGRVTTYVFKDNKLDSVESGSQYGVRTYDANGYLDLVHDFENGVSDYDYDAHGHLLQLTEGKGTTAERTTSFTWDESRNLLAGKTRPDQFQVSYTYTDRGRLSNVVEQNLSANGVPGQQRATSYTYAYQGNGLLASMIVDGPLAGSMDAVTTTYGADGFPSSVRNGAGHTTSYSEYDALGMVGRVTGANDEVTRFTYDARGRILTKSITLPITGTQSTTVFTYTPAGDLSTRRDPDGMLHTFLYAPAGRMEREYQPGPGGTVALVRYAYNAASQITSVSRERSSAPSAGVPALSAPGQSSTGAYAVNWSGIADASEYWLEESSNGAAFTAIQIGAGTNRAVAGKPPGSYGYRVKACNEAGCGGYSNEVTVAVIAAPAYAPSLSAPGANSTGNLNINWSGVAGSTSYRLEESANGGGWVLVHQSGGTGVTLTGKNINVAHAYRVQGCNDAGCGPYSGTAYVQQAIYGAQFISQSVPAVMAAGRSHTVSVQLRNTGNVDWVAGENYRLGSQNPGDNLTWGAHRIDPPGAVPPGGVATFTFNVIAPASVGTWNFQWRMVRDGYAWFGDSTPNLRIPTMSGSISASPNPCTIYRGEGTCTSRLTWSSTWSEAKVWVSNIDGSGMVLFADGQSGGQSASWITTDTRRFHLISAGQTLATVDVRGNAVNQYRPEPPETCSTPKCVPR